MRAPCMTSTCQRQELSMNQENQGPPESAAKGCVFMSIVMIISMVIAVAAVYAAQAIFGF